MLPKHGGRIDYKKNSISRLAWIVKRKGFQVGANIAIRGALVA